MSDPKPVDTQAENNEEIIDTSWVTPMGKRARMLINNFNSEDPDTKAEAASQIVAVGEQLEYFVQMGQPLTEAQKALMNLYKQIVQEKVA